MLRKAIPAFARTAGMAGAQVKIMRHQNDNNDVSTTTAMTTVIKMMIMMTKDNERQTQATWHTTGNSDTEYNSGKLMSVVRMIHVVDQSHHLIIIDTATTCYTFIWWFSAAEQKILRFCTSGFLSTRLSVSSCWKIDQASNDLWRINLWQLLTRDFERPTLFSF